MSGDEYPFKSRKIKIARTYRRNDEGDGDRRPDEEMKISIPNENYSESQHHPSNGKEKDYSDTENEKSSKSNKKSKKHKKEHKHKDKNASKHRKSDSRDSDEDSYRSKKHKKKSKKKSKDKDKDKERGDKRDKESKEKITQDYNSSDWDTDYEEKQKLKKLEKTLQSQKESSWYKLDENELSKIEQGLHLKGTEPVKDTQSTKDELENFEKKVKLSKETESIEPKAKNHEDAKEDRAKEKDTNKQIKIEKKDDKIENKTKVTGPEKEPGAIELVVKVPENEPKKDSTDSVFEKETIEPQPSTSGTVKKPGVLGLSLGLKLSATSRALISSGVTQDDIRKQNMEEGELTESDGSGSGSSEDKEDGEDDTDGEIKKDKKARKRKHKDKDKDKDKDRKRHKTDRSSADRSKSSSSKRSKASKRRGRSRSRSPGAARGGHSGGGGGDFDKRTGVWRSSTPPRGGLDRRRRSCSRSRDRSRSRSRERERSRDRGTRDTFYASFYRTHRSRSRDRGRRRSRSRERSRSNREEDDLRLKIDKNKLREIALRNAVANMKAGRGPTVNLKPDEVAALKAGGKSINELTEFCKKIAGKAGGTGEKLSSDESGDDSHLYPHSDDEPFSSSVHHPFRAPDTSSAIAINIKNARQLPTSTPVERTIQGAELRLQFPVSSGSQHRAHESEWVPVEKKPPVPSTSQAGPSKPPRPPQASPTPGPSSGGPLAIQAPPPPQQPPQQPPKDSIFPDAPKEDINIGSIVSDRLSALRRLQDNPNDVQALNTCYKANKAMTQWASSKQLPGQFTGHSSGILPMRPRDHSAGPQAWARKDQLKTAAPVSAGIGKLLLERMGWKSGEGLGKNKEGSTQPLMLDIKNDRRGLSGADEGVATKCNIPKPRPLATTVRLDMSGKHPVSALMEICNKRHWPSPQFTVVTETGPDHKKNFLFKVLVNRVEYQPTCGSSTKKQAKALAAQVCLQALGMVPNT